MHSAILATPLTRTLDIEGHATVAFLRGPAPSVEKADRAYRFIYSVGEHALSYHFNEPLARLGVGRVAQRAVEVALQLGLAGLRVPLRRLLSGLDDGQHLRIADEIEARLVSDERINGETMPSAAPRLEILEPTA